MVGIKRVALIIFNITKLFIGKNCLNFKENSKSIKFLIGFKLINSFEIIHCVLQIIIL